MKTYVTFYNLTFGDRIFACTIHYCYTPGSPGVRYFPDGSGEPPTPPELDICNVDVISITLKDGVLISDEWLVESGWSTIANDFCQKAIEKDYKAYDDLIFYADYEYSRA